MGAALRVVDRHVGESARSPSDSGVWPAVKRSTGANVQSSSGERCTQDARVSASRAFRSSIDATGLGLTGAASVLGVSPQRVAAKCNEDRADVPVTLADVIALGQAGGRGGDAARRILTAMLDQLDAGISGSTASPSQLPSLAAEMMSAVADVSRTALMASSGSITSDGRRSVQSTAHKMEAICAKMRAAVRDE